MENHLWSSKLEEIKLKKISGYDLQKGRISENKFDCIVEVGRYYDYSIKEIAKRIYKQLAPLGWWKQWKE